MATLSPLIMQHSNAKSDALENPSCAFKNLNYDDDLRLKILFLEIWNA